MAWGSSPPGEKFVTEMGGGMGFPVPVVFAWGAALAEFVGGLLLAAGFLTRPAALLIAINMGIAGFVFHAADPFGRKELALLYFCIAAAFLFAGAGRWSIDAVLTSRNSR